jgi:hypothetical protein
VTKGQGRLGRTERGEDQNKKKPHLHGVYKWKGREPAEASARPFRCDQFTR